MKCSVVIVTSISFTDTSHIVKSVAKRNLSARIMDTIDMPELPETEREALLDRWVEMLWPQMLGHDGGDPNERSLRMEAGGMLPATYPRAMAGVDELLFVAGNHDGGMALHPMDHQPLVPPDVPDDRGHLCGFDMRHGVAGANVLILSLQCVNACVMYRVCVCVWQRSAGCWCSTNFHTRPQAHASLRGETASARTFAICVSVSTPNRPKSDTRTVCVCCVCSDVIYDEHF